MPLWVPASDAGFAQADVSRAIAAGLEFRPMAETVCDTLGWEEAVAPAARAGSVAMTLSREAGLLRQWHSRR